MTYSGPLNDNDANIDSIKNLSPTYSKALELN